MSSSGEYIYSSANQNENFLSTKSTGNSVKILEKHQNQNQDVEDDLNNIDLLKEMILVISNDYDSCKNKLNQTVNTLFEKENIIQELLKDILNKEEDHNLELLIMNEEINKLKDKIQEFEIDLYQKNLTTENKKSYKKVSMMLRKSVLIDKYDYSSDDEDQDGELKFLRKELIQKENEIQKNLNEFEIKIKTVEDKYNNYICELQNDFQETLKIKKENDSYLKKQLNEIDETRDVVEKRNLLLINENKILENKLKNNKFECENEKIKLIEEIETLRKILDEKNECLKELEDFNNRHNKMMKEFTLTKVNLAGKDKIIEKLENQIKLINKEIENRDNEKKHLIIEYNELKVQFVNLGNHLKENSSRLLEEMKIEKLKIYKKFENEKKEMILKMEKMNEVIESLNVTIEKLKKSESRESNAEIVILNKNLVMNNKKSIMRLNTCINKIPYNYESVTLLDCLSENEEENCDEENLKESKNKIDFYIKEIDHMEKNYKELLNKYEELKNINDLILNQNFEMKSNLANEQFERDTLMTNFRIKIKKLKEFLVKNEVGLAIKFIS